MRRYQNYISRIMCGQCRYQARIKIPIGMRIEEIPCPKCGLKELHHPSYFLPTSHPDYLKV